MAKNKGYEDLQVWQQSIELAVVTYNVTKNFPTEEKFGLTSQMRRAAYSVPSNIAEGCNRNSSNEFQQFLSIAQGSLGELKTQMIIAHRVNLLAKDKFDIIVGHIDIVGRMLNALQNSLRKTTSNHQLATNN